MVFVNEFPNVYLTTTAISIVMALILYKFSGTDTTFSRHCIFSLSATFMYMAFMYGLTDPYKIEAAYCMFGSVFFALMSIYLCLDTFGFTIKITPSNKKNITIQQ